MKITILQLSPAKKGISKFSTLKGLFTISAVMWRIIAMWKTSAKKGIPFLSIAELDMPETKSQTRKSGEIHGESDCPLEYILDAKEF